MNFLDCFWEEVQQHPDKMAVIDRNGARGTTYRDLYVKSGRVAAKLIAAGDITGKAVIVCMDSRMEYAAAEIGIMMAQAACVPLPAENSKERIRYIWKDCAASGMIDAAWMQDVSRYEPVVKSGASDAEQAVIFYTSGLAGCPKGIVYSHAGLFEETVRSMKAPDFKKKEHLAVAAPMSSAFAVLACLSIFISGGCVHILSRQALIP